MPCSCCGTCRFKLFKYCISFCWCCTAKVLGRCTDVAAGAATAGAGAAGDAGAGAGDIRPGPARAGSAALPRLALLGGTTETCFVIICLSGDKCRGGGMACTGGMAPFSKGLSGDPAGKLCTWVSGLSPSRNTSMAAAMGDLAPCMGLTGFMQAGGGGVTMPDVYWAWEAIGLNAFTNFRPDPGGVSASCAWLTSARILGPSGDQSPGFESRSLACEAADAF